MIHPLATYLEMGTVSSGLLDWLRECRDSPNFDETVPESILNLALFKSAEWGHSSVVELLLQKDAVDVNAEDEETGCTALHVAAWNGQVAVAELLVSFGADLNAKGEYLESTALHIAVETGCL